MTRKPRRASGPIVPWLALGAAALLAAPALAQDEKKVELPPEPQAVPELNLAPLPTFPVTRGRSAPNVQFVDTTLLPRDKAPRLDYVGQEQGKDFTLGQALKGEQSGATALIASDLDNGDNGTLTLARLQGEFRDGESIVDAKGGSAQVKGAIKPGIWVLDFAFKPIRVQTVEIPGKGRRKIYYMYYRVINHTNKARPFVPQFTLVLPESGRAYQDVVLPNAVEVLKLIETREDPSVPLLGAVNCIGSVTPSTRQGVDDAVFGVAMWEVDDAIAKADRLSIYVRGLSDGYKRITTPEGEASQVRYKTLQINIDRPGDERQLSNREFRLLDPPYEWTYW